jgi:hypothetical protein
MSSLDRNQEYIDGVLRYFAGFTRQRESFGAMMASLGRFLTLLPVYAVAAIVLTGIAWIYKENHFGTLAKVCYSRLSSNPIVELIELKQMFRRAYCSRYIISTLTITIARPLP